MSDIEDIVRRIVRDEIAKQAAPANDGAQPAEHLLTTKKRWQIASRRRGGSRPALDKPGFVYVIALIPELRGNRIKIGFTAQDPADRLAQIACTNPSAELLRVWKGTPLDEQRLHLLVDGRIGATEVFDCKDAAVAIRTIDAYFARDPADRKVPLP